MITFFDDHKVIITAIALILMIVELIRSKTRPELVLGSVVMIFLVVGYIEVDTLLSTFTNKGILTIFLIISITSAINNHIDIPGNIEKLLGKIRSKSIFLAIFGGCVAFISSIFNNTPVVILLIPYVKKKARAFQVSPSKFLIPLSYFAILGGMLTVIGTSTNLLLNGLLEDKNLEPFYIKDFLVPGILVCFSGIAFLATFSSYLLPDKTPIEDNAATNARKFFIEAKITPNSFFANKPIAESGIKNFRGVSLLEIIRNDQIFKVLNSRNLILKKNDRLIFLGSLEDVRQLNASSTNIELTSKGRFPEAHKMEYVELSIPSNSYLDGKKIKETNFRQRYGATVLAVHRNKEDISGRIGETVLKSGDLLIIAPHEQITQAVKSDFHILSNISSDKKTTRQKVLLGIGLSALIIITVLFGVNLLTFLLLTVILLIALRYLTSYQIKRDFQFDLFIILISSIIIGEVFINSGLAAMVSRELISITQTLGTPGILMALMVFTVILTSLITNVAAVSIAFPLAYSIAQTTTIPDKALYIAIAFAASAAFSTPIGYQTNLMVMAPGNYVFKDFFKIGFPLTVLYIFVVWGYLLVQF